MTKVVANKEKLTSAKNAINTAGYGEKTYSRKISEALEFIRYNSGSTAKVDLYSSLVSNSSSDPDKEYDYTRFAVAYNTNMDNIYNLGESARTISTNLYDETRSLDSYLKRINAYESSEAIASAIAALGKVTIELEDQTYGDVSYYESDGTVDDVPEDTPSSGPTSQISGGGETTTAELDPDTETEEFAPLDESETETSGPETEEEQPGPSTGLEESEEETEGPETEEEQPGPSTGLEESEEEPEGPETEEEQPGPSTGLEEGDPEVDEPETEEEQPGPTTGQDPTPIDIISIGPDPAITEGGGGPTNTGLTHTGADGLDDWESAAAAAGGIMLGLAGLTGGSNGEYLENLATGLDGDRTLAGAGLDVFDHPDYTGDVDDPQNLGVNLDANGNVIGGDGTEVDGEFDNGEIGAFGLNPSEAGGEGADGEGSKAGFAGSLGALAGAAAIGGVAAGGLMAYDESSGGMFDGGAGIGPDGKYTETKKSLNDALFGPPIDGDDEEEQKKQSLREKIAMIATASSTTAALGTFGLANGGVIGPTWFTIAALLFAVSLLYFNMVKDQKNKRREEIAAMKKTTAQGKKSFFGGTNLSATTQATPANQEVDWILFGMILLSTSGFILKTYDVIDWLLFLILLILFVLIIVAYIILKKKMGEDDKKGPMKK